MMIYEQIQYLTMDDYMTEGNLITSKLWLQDE